MNHLKITIPYLQLDTSQTVSLHRLSLTPKPGGISGKQNCDGTGFTASASQILHINVSYLFTDLPLKIQGMCIQGFGGKI